MFTLLLNGSSYMIHYTSRFNLSTLLYNSTFQVSFSEILRGLRVGKCGDSNYIISQKLKVFTAQSSKLDQLSLQGARGSRRCSNYLIPLLANLPTNTNIFGAAERCSNYVQQLTTLLKTGVLFLTRQTSELNKQKI